MGKIRRVTVIVETEKGIVLTAMSGGTFLLPGGVAERGESRFRAAIRELEEETGLIAHHAEILFNHESKSHKHTVVYIKANGTPKPKKEVKYIDYYKPGKNIKMSKATKEIIYRYLESYKRSL